MLSSRQNHLKAVYTFMNIRSGLQHLRRQIIHGPQKIDHQSFSSTIYNQPCPTNGYAYGNTAHLLLPARRRQYHQAEPLLAPASDLESPVKLFEPVNSDDVNWNPDKDEFGISRSPYAPPSPRSSSNVEQLTTAFEPLNTCVDEKNMRQALKELRTTERRSGVQLSSWTTKFNAKVLKLKDLTKSKNSSKNVFSRQRSSKVQNEEQIKFQRLLRSRMNVLRSHFANSPHSHLFGITKPDLMTALFDYEELLVSAIFESEEPKFVSDFAAATKRSKRPIQAVPTFDVLLKAHFVGLMRDLKNVASDRDLLGQIADMQFPGRWFNKARQMPRRIHLHVGPTNSGKTYQALQQLQKAKSGAYAGPLRLLAREVYSKLQAAGLPSNLVTGDDRRINHEAEESITSYTVEMLSTVPQYEVAVIDEIQMLGEAYRGPAWTQALLGVPAKEVHLCGEVRCIPLVKKIAAMLGEEVEVHTYQRLNPLQLTPTHVKEDLSNLQRGDCIVCFDRATLKLMRERVESMTGRKCAVVYGSLPPLVRAQQADLFNASDNDYDYLVATDAIGMGLNLQIKRMIFSTVRKRTKAANNQLIEASTIKQIAGRAGRYKAPRVNSTDVPSPVAAQEPGLVTAMSAGDFQHVRWSMKHQPRPLEHAMLSPTPEIIERFAAQFPPETPFSYILIHFYEIARFHPSGIFANPNMSDSHIVNLITDDVAGLSINDRMLLSLSPVRSSFKQRDLLLKLARIVAGELKADLLDFEEIDFELLDRPLAQNSVYQEQLEELHSSLELYLWLSFRFPIVFKSRAVAEHARTIVEEKINAIIENNNAEQKENISMTEALDSEEDDGNAEEEGYEEDEDVPILAEIPRG